MTALPPIEELERITLFRYETGDQGTFGIFRGPSPVRFHSIELPWRGNENNISCIPNGLYRCFVRHSNKYGLAYEVENVPGRSAILIHLGNWAGDASLGYRTNSYGCILLGLSRGVAYGQKAILNSRAAILEFMTHMDNVPFALNIIGKGEPHA